MNVADVITSAPIVNLGADSVVEKSGAPAIRVRGLRKRYGSIEAVRGIDLDIHNGEIFGLIGPDGAGKTSVFQILGGVMEATAGEAKIGRASCRERV